MSSVVSLFISCMFDGSVFYLIFRSSDTSEDEMDDQDIQKIIIVTQTSPVHRKHPGGDRTGNFTSKTKISSDMAQAINDGLYFYEQVSLYHTHTHIVRVSYTCILHGHRETCIHTHIHVCI